MNIKGIFRALLFKPEWTCAACGAELFEEGYFCPECLKTLPFNREEICAHCGRHVKTAESYCDTCRNFEVDIDLGRSAFDYTGEIPRLIKNFKYKNRRYLAKIFAHELMPLAYKNFPKADVMVYVPMTDRAKRKRGYNQTELLANELSSLTGLPVSQALIKRKDTARQATLDRTKRMRNLEGTFALTDKTAFDGKRVIIIDDVTTTGATAEVIAKLLKKHGAAEVYLLTVASVSKKRKF